MNSVGFVAVVFVAACNCCFAIYMHFNCNTQYGGMERHKWTIQIIGYLAHNIIVNEVFTVTVHEEFCVF